MEWVSSYGLEQEGTRHAAGGGWAEGDPTVNKVTGGRYPTGGMPSEQTGFRLVFRAKDDDR